MQAILGLQQEKADAIHDAQQWQAASQAAENSCDSAETRRIEVEGQLLAKRNEVEGLQQTSAQQSQVSSQFDTLKTPVVWYWLVGF